MKHTPGPWYESITGKGQGLIIAEDTGENIAVSYNRINAKLIAAAPDLLDFVIQYLYSAHDICDPEDCAAPYTPEELKDMAINILENR